MNSYLTTLKPISLILSLAFTGALMAQPHQISVPILDNPTFTKTIKSFRSPLWQKAHAPQQHLQGIEKLRVSASGQFSESTLSQAFKDHPNLKILIVDLRMESHGFMDGNPISWYGKHNAINKGLALPHIIEKENLLLHKLQQEERIQVNQIVSKKSGIIYEVEPKTYQVSRIESEQALVSRLGYGYQRLPILDRYPPTDQTVDQFVTLVSNQPQESWLHLHCRAGKGRATTMMVLYDIIQNGPEMSLEAILDRHAYFGPKDIRKISDAPDKLWKKPMAIERLNKIKQFYQYRLSSDYSTVPWSRWVQKNPI